MIIEPIEDGEKHPDDNLKDGIVIYPETNQEVKVINKLLNHPEYLETILKNIEI